MKGSIFNKTNSIYCNKVDDNLLYYKNSSSFYRINLRTHDCFYREHLGNFNINVVVLLKENVNSIEEANNFIKNYIESKKIFI